MYSIRNLLLPLAALAFMGVPNQASADFEIYAQQAGVNGGAITLLASGSDFSAISFSGTYGDFGIVGFFGASSNGAAFSDLLSSTVRVTNNNAATRTINLYASQTDYTLPVSNLLLVTSGVGGSVTAGTLGLTDIFQAYADSDNALLGTTDFTNGPQDATGNGTFDTGTVSGVFDRTGGPYSLTSVFTGVLSGGAVINFGSSVVATPVPVPATLALLVSGLPGLFFLRRRKAKV